MNTITRRGALRAVAAIAATAAVPVAAMASDTNGDAALLARVDGWHRAYEKFKETERFEEERFYEERPKNRYELYTPGSSAGSEDFWAAHEELCEVQPKTLAGAIILLGCAQRNAADRGSWNCDYREPQIVYRVDTDRLSENAYATLRRLAGGMRS